VTAIHVEVTAEDIEPMEGRMSWADPVEAALARLTGEEVDVDGGEIGGPNIATIGQGEWTLVVELPAAANLWLNGRWADDDVKSEPFGFDLEVPEWVVGLVYRAVDGAVRAEGQRGAVLTTEGGMTGPAGTLLTELRAARDHWHDAERLQPDRIDPELDKAIGATWGTAISIVERFLEPMKGLEPDDRAGLADKWPCLPGERHTFDAGAMTCLCGALAASLSQVHPSVCLYAPADAPDHPDPLAGPGREVRG
jgi:hypothetical protein